MSAWEPHGMEDTALVGPTALLKRDVASGRVSHAYLFAGATGRPAMEAALGFGAALVCPEAGCGTCDACLRVAHHAHPDVEVIEPAGVQLLVEQVRDVVRAASRRPVVAPRRVIVVDGADRMNPTAQNAFLKALEEPPPSTTIVLIAPDPDALLETVRSRCRTVLFRAPPQRRVAEILTETGVDAERARRCARLGGDLHRATTLATDDQARGLREELVRRVLASPADPGEALEAAAWLAESTKQLRDGVAEVHAERREAFRDWYQETKRVADDRLRREQRRTEQDALDAAIDDVLSVLRDLLVSVSSGGDLLNVELADEIDTRAAALGPGAEARLIGCMGEIERCRRRLRGNANVLLTLEEVFLALYRYAGGRQLP